MIRHRIRSFTELLDLEAPSLPSTAKRLAAAMSIEDLHRLARRRTPGFALDYVEGGAITEASVQGNLDAFASRRLRPGYLRGIGQASLETDFLGRRHALPFGIAPIGLTGLMRTEGELAGVAAAESRDIPFALSTMGTRSIEDVAAAGPGARKLFQLYVRKGREANTGLLERAWENGFDTLVVTADTPVSGRRLRDEHNHLSMPPKLTGRTVVQSALHPAWALDLVRNDAPALANFERTELSVHQLVGSMFDPDLALADLDWIRDAWPGKFVIKGVLGAEDARRVADAGADAIWVSNHGGRQLDRAVASIDVVQEVRAAVGEQITIAIDSGIRTGTDIVTALAAGADYCFLGRAYLYGLMAGGQAGVERALDILAIETKNAMQLLGVASTMELRARGVELLVR